MSQGVLPFKYEVENNRVGMTALGGLPVYLDLLHVSGLFKLAGKHLGVRKTQGWSDGEMLTSLVLLNLAGGQCVEDLRIVEADEGFCRVLRKSRMHGLRRGQRRELQRRWRKEKKRSVPSASAAFRYLSCFHDGDQERFRQLGKAYIPRANRHLRGFSRINRDFLSFVQSNNAQSVATLDMDATLVETTKTGALWCYKGYRSYQPLNTWWCEQGMVLHSEFRDGNVPAGYEQLRVFKESLGCLPDGVKTVRLRSDAAGYQHEVLKYCDLGNDKRFGRIEFAIGCPVGDEFKKAVSQVGQSEWKPLLKKVKGRHIDTGRQWAEVCFVPNAIGHSKKAPEYRYLAIREPMAEQQILPGIDAAKPYSFPTMTMSFKNYKVFGLVTNMDWAGDDLICWYHKRCGKSEQAHGVMKKDLAGGKLPSKDFGQNAAWWWIMILAMNLNAAMKSFVLGGFWICKQMKAIRFRLINVPARVLERSRSLLIRFCRGHPWIDALVQARATIAQLVPALV